MSGIDLGLALGLFPTKRRMQDAIGDAIARKVGTEVNTYADLPDAAEHDGEYAWVINSQGTKWLPGTLGGTYYPKGLYYSVGGNWEWSDSPVQATQGEVDAGTVTDKFVSPKTLADSTSVRSVKTYASVELFPPAGLENIIYISTSNEKIYRWDSVSSTYIPLRAEVDKTSITDVDGYYWYIGYSDRIERVNTLVSPYIVQYCIIEDLSESWALRETLTYI